jgi:predicted RNase H-like HicB family nuclease
MKFLVTLERDEAGWIVAECPALPGCVSQGKSEAEALENIKEAIELSLETRQAGGLPLALEVAEIEVKTSAE